MEVPLIYNFKIKFSADFNKYFYKGSIEEFTKHAIIMTYAVATDFETREARMQDLVNRQNSIKTDVTEIKDEWDRIQDSVIELTKSAYERALELGIAKEQARAVLPEGLTASTMYVNGTLRSWIHYIELRSANGTQLEHIEIAHAVADVIAKIFPLAEEFKGKDI